MKLFTFTFKDANRHWWKVEATELINIYLEDFWYPEEWEVVFSCEENNQRIVFTHLGEYPTEYILLQKLIEYTTSLAFSALPPNPLKTHD